MKVLLATITLAMIVVVHGRGRSEEARNCRDAYSKAYNAYVGCLNECNGGEDLTRKAAYEVRGLPLSTYAERGGCVGPNADVVNEVA